MGSQKRLESGGATPNVSSRELVEIAALPPFAEHAATKTSPQQSTAFTSATSDPTAATTGNPKQRHASHSIKRTSNNDHGIKKEERIGFVWDACLTCRSPSNAEGAWTVSVYFPPLLFRTEACTAPLLARQLWRATDVSVICVAFFLLWKATDVSVICVDFFLSGGVRQRRQRGDFYKLSARDVWCGTAALQTFSGPQNKLPSGPGTPSGAQMPSSSILTPPRRNAEGSQRAPEPSQEDALEPQERPRTPN